MKNTSCFKEFVKYSSLNVLGMIGLSCYILADTFFVSKGLGTNGLAALNLAIPIYSFIHGSGLMLGIGGATKYSILRSQGKTGAGGQEKTGIGGRESVRNSHELDCIYTNTVKLAAILAALFFISGVFFSRSITALLGADGEVSAMTNTYLRMILLFAPAFMMNDVLICFVRNDGNPRLSMTAMITGSMANILLDYLFIFPLGMGIFGAVLATGLAPLISMGILARHWLNKKNGFHLAGKGSGFQMSRPILSLGFPSLITEVSSGLVIIIFNIIILNLQGNVGVAAYGVIANLSLVVISMFTGIAQGIQPLVSRAYGYNNPSEVRQVLRYALTSVLVLSIVLYAVIFTCAAPIASIFNSQQNMQLQSIAQTGLKLYFTAMVFAGFNIVLSILFTSTEKAFPAHAVSLMRGLILIVPMAFFLSSLWGMTGVWMAFPVTEFLTAVMGASIYFALRKNFI